MPRSSPKGDCHVPGFLGSARDPPGEQCYRYLPAYIAGDSAEDVRISVQLTQDGHRFCSSSLDDSITGVLLYSLPGYFQIAVFDIDLHYTSFVASADLNLSGFSNYFWTLHAVMFL